ncbi:MAG: histidinol-phosphatase HisJ family protein [Clostridia bacterium]|nr:histidinol-phosphatase HisJ family protein [Clostridia bacterium]
MLSNLHTHTNLCDGNDTPEEMVNQAIEMGFSSLGFSGHAPTPFRMDYCIQDIGVYITEIKRLKEKYKNDIQIYLGIEEDAFAPIDRSRFEYMIGSYHFIKKDGQYYSIDITPDDFAQCVAACGGPLEFAKEYYKGFCDYILARKPDIIGHFDLITKYEEKYTDYFFTNKDYFEIAKRYINEATKAECMFELNSGAISRGYRTKPYPAENLLYELKKADAKMIVTSDCHNRFRLDCNFEESKKMLKDIGFKHTYVLYNNEFVKEFL